MGTQLEAVRALGICLKNSQPGTGAVCMIAKLQQAIKRLQIFSLTDKKRCPKITLIWSLVPVSTWSYAKVSEYISQPKTCMYACIVAV